MAGIIPRSLTYLNLSSLVFWMVLIAIIILLFLWLIKIRKLNFDNLILLSFITLPFLHDYDLIQLIPLLESNQKKVWAVISSIPLWFTIFLAYNNDQAWFTATLIAPILFYFFNKETKRI